MVKWMWKKILRDLLDALKEVVDEWLAKEGKPLPKDSPSHTTGNDVFIKPNYEPHGENLVVKTREQANEVLKGRR